MSKRKFRRRIRIRIREKPQKKSDLERIEAVIKSREGLKAENKEERI